MRALFLVTGHRDQPRLLSVFEVPVAAFRFGVVCAKSCCSSVTSSSRRFISNVWSWVSDIPVVSIVWVWVVPVKRESAAAMTMSFFHGCY